MRKNADKNHEMNAKIVLMMTVGTIIALLLLGLSWYRVFTAPAQEAQSSLWTLLSDFASETKSLIESE